jgi:acetylornithine/N-succinyldiaminopimelate aminotransferase
MPTDNAAVKLSAELSEESPLCEIYSQYPFEIARGEGVYVYDTNGKRYIDLYGGHAVSSIGHCPKTVLEAIQKQGSELMFYSNLARVPIRVRAAQKLIDYAANGLTKAFFCNSGGEANENAIKIAIKITGRAKVASFSGSFHGRTLLAITATDHPDWHEYLQPRVDPIVQLAPNEEADLAKIDASVACVILEPIQSIGGVTEFRADYLKKLRAACDNAGAMLIFDEVQTGIGRTGVPFVSGHCGVTPEMMTLAKGLAGGFPIGAVVMSKEVAAALQTGDIAATFGGGPLAMAAMEATLDHIARNNLARNARDIESYVRQRFSEPSIKEHITEVRGRGCLLGLVLNVPSKPIQQELFKRGIITGPNANQKLVHLLPPLTVERGHIDQLHDALRMILEVERV